MVFPFLDKDEATGAATIPLRAEIPLADTWDLTPLFSSSSAWQEAFAALQRDYEGLVQFRGRLGESASTLREALEFEKSLDLQIERLRGYAGLKCAEDSSDAENLGRESQLTALLTRIGEAASFIAPEIQAIDDETFAQCVADPILADWLIPLRRLRRLKPHTLSASEERLMALVRAALRGHDNTFSQLTDVDMKWGTIIDDEGQERTITQSSWMSLLLRRNSDLRRRTFQQFYAEFADHKFTLASTLAHSVKADLFQARARNYPSALESALFHDDVPVAVYDNLISSVRANFAPLFHYLELRKRVLGLDELHQYDLFVPLVPQIETRVPFEQAIETVLAALAPLGEEYRQVLGDGLRTQRWCDRYENKGKTSGAFSAGSYRYPPYLLMNYKEDVFGDVYTLAHEVGHSMHTWYAVHAQPFQTYDYPIFLAEVASTFNECLLTHHLLETTSDPKMRAYIISREIDTLRSTVYRQTMFAEFEKLIHGMEERGEPLTLDIFRQTYRALLEAYFGDGFTIDPELDLECLRIPHFYNAFYVYKYATGLSAAVALAEQVLAGGPIEKYLSFLRSGGSQFPIPTLQAAGVDMSEPGPVEATLRLFERRVDELEHLL